MINFHQSIFGNKNPIYLGGNEVETGIDTASTDLLECLVCLEDSFLLINSEHMKATHIGIVSENVEIITEGMKDMLKSATEFFKTIIKKIGELFKKCFMSINSYLGDFEKFLKKYDKELKELKPDWSLQGYDYTISDSLPKISVIESIVGEYNRQISNITKLTKADIEKERDAFNNDTFLTKLRGEIIGTGGNISLDKYVSEVKKSYRDGKDNTDTIRVDKDRLGKAMSGYSTLNSSYKKAKELETKTLRMLTDIKLFFEKGASVNYVGNEKKIQMNDVSLDDGELKKGEKQTFDSSSQNIEIANKYFNFKFHQAKILANLLSIATTEKIIAIKEQLKQERNIVRGSLKGSNSIKDDDGKGDK